MASLTNELINATYESLIKTNDNAAIDATMKALTDGVGNALTIAVSTTGVDFSGNVDFSAATVSGLPDTNTTYDFGAVGAAGNISFALTGSDATNDVVVMQAGTNITLTDNGSNTFTIDAAGGGGGGATTSTVISTGQIHQWAGPAGQDVIICQATIPANTIKSEKPATIEFRFPVDEGSEGQWIYVSAQIAPIPGDFNYVNFLGRQTVSGGGDPHMWYRTMNVGINGDVYMKDDNNYFWPCCGGDPIQVFTNMDWTVDNYFTVTVWADAANALFRVYSPSLIITTQA